MPGKKMSNSAKSKATRSRKETETDEKPKKKGQPENNKFPMVCLGASAGGLKAIEAFLSSLPRKSGIAFVVISHTDPERVSLLPEILRRRSIIPIEEIQQDQIPEQNTVYLPPSDKDAVIEEGRFQLKHRGKRQGLHMPIDSFLESLAKDFGENSGCIILSGTGTDGTHGLRLIKEAGGVSFAEAESSASHYGMPQSAVETGLVDFVMEPARMPEQLIEYFKHPITFVGSSADEEMKDEKLPMYLKDILRLLASRTHHDFSCYKRSTLIRRIERRMAVTRTRNAESYCEYLRGNVEESEALFQELLIGVTEFFRDLEAYTTLEEEVLPRLFSQMNDDENLRIWVAGCATGEEVYSIAIVVLEYMEKHKINCQMQIFGTDIDTQAIEVAREGVYLPNIVSKVSKERLDRFFIKEGERYRVRREIREPVIFAVQDLLRDPPFTKLHILFCRNLLIYLNSDAQSRLIPLFHYSLRSEGTLFLGSSETIGRFGELFTAIDRKHVYIKRDVPYFARPEVQFPTGTGIHMITPEHAHSGVGAKPKAALGIAQAAEHLLLERYTPACVIVDSEGHLLHIHGKTGKYLELPSGKPNLDITALAREGLRFALTSGLRKAVASRKETCHNGIKVKTNSEFEATDVSVIPLSEPQELKNTYLIKFEKSPASPPKALKDDRSKTETDDVTGRILELEQELIRVREDYRSAIEELETSNEELKSVNEEMHSGNEELQSTNEELESSREELQSLNEELNTVNSQLESKNVELVESYASITDVLNSTKIAILFLNNNLTVKRFTPEAASLLNLVSYDAGRPIGYISHNLEKENLTEAAQGVLDTLSPFEEDVRTKDGHCYRLSIRIDRSRSNVIEGIVATFVNIDVQKRTQVEIQELKEKEVRAERRFSESIVDTVRESLLVLDDRFYVLKANRRFYDAFQKDETQIEGKRLFDLDNGRWNIPRLKDKLERILHRGGTFENFTVEEELPGTGQRSLLLNARQLVTDDDKNRRILLAIDTISDWDRLGKNTE